MTQADEQDRVLRRYLLGGLTEAEETRLEREYLTTAEAQARLLLVEDDLVEAYAAGRLAAGERARLEARFFASPRGQRRAAVARGLWQIRGRGGRR